jgi:hypothetical protein
LGRRQAVRLRVLVPPFVGSNPSAPVLTNRKKKNTTCALNIYELFKTLRFFKKKLDIFCAPFAFGAACAFAFGAYAPIAPIARAPLVRLVRSVRVRVREAQGAKSKKCTVFCSKIFYF